MPPTSPTPAVGEDGHRLRVGVAAMHEHRLADPMRQLELAAEDALLDVGRRQVPEEVEPDLAHRDHTGARRQLLDLP